MINGVESILLFSENAKRLADFYKEKVGLKMTMEAEIGDKGERLYGFEMGESGGLYIIDHSKVKGRNNSPERIMFNLEVDNIEAEVEKAEKVGVKKVQDIYHMQGYGKIVTLEDIDGNYFQLVQIRES